MSDTPAPMTLQTPALALLPSYVAALERGYSADNLRGHAAAIEELARIAKDGAAFIAACDDREGRLPAVTLIDGTVAPRLPGFRRWMWDGEFAGSISLRWQPGSSDLPAHVLGHVGYAVPAWKQRRGYATRALAAILGEARGIGLDRIIITADPSNLASQKVIRANGGVLVDRFAKPAGLGGGESLRFRIAL